MESWSWMIRLDAGSIARLPAPEDNFLTQQEASCQIMLL